MVEELPRKEATHSGVERTPTEEEVSVPAGYEDPHKAALEDDPEQARKLTLPVILSALFLGTSFSAPIVFGFILVTHILVQISQRVGGSDISFWIPSGWGAAAAVTFSVAGRLSDIFGRRGVILFGQLLCVVGGIVACTSHSMNQLIAGEVILGASIGIISAAYAGLSEILPNKYRAIGLAWTELNIAVWAVPATLFGNAVTSNASWRVIFYLGIGFSTFSFVGTFLVYFPPSHPRPDGKTRWQEFKELDFVGIFLFTAGLAVFLYGLNSGGNMYPWSAAGTLAPLILGFVTFIGAFVYDAFVPEDPLFPWHLFKQFREFSSLLVLVFVAGMVFFAASALSSQTILYLYTSDPIKIGVYSLPSGVGQLIGGTFVPAFAHYMKRVDRQLIFGASMQVLFFGLMALVTPDNINWVMAVQFFAFFPWGWIVINCYATATLHVPQRDLGIAVGLIGTFRSVGGSVGSVLFSTIFRQTAEKEVAKRVAATAIAAGVPPASVGKIMQAVAKTLVGVPGQAAKLQGVSGEAFEACVRAARYGYAYGLRITWLASIPFGVLAVLAAMAVRDPSRYFTNHVEIQLARKRGGRHTTQTDKQEEKGEVA